MKEKTIRDKGQWVRIVREDDKRFSFAHGFEGNFKAFDYQIWPVKAVPTWKQAVEHAEERIEDHK